MTQPSTSTAPSVRDMLGKTVLVTGATSGIGKEAARALAARGADLVLIGRDPSRTAQAADELRAVSGAGKVETIVADLSDLAQVRRAAEEFKASHRQLHVLLNNAGAFNQERHLTKDDFETTFAVNHLAYVLLTRELLDVLRATPGARIVNVASSAEGFGKLDWDNLQGEKKYNGSAAYGLSKLANVMFTYELARRLKNSGVTVNAVHPGLVNSNFGDGSQGLIGAVFGAMKRLAGRTPERGARTLVYLAASPEVEGVSGKFWSDERPIRSSARSLDQGAQLRLWNVSEELIDRALAGHAPSAARA